MPETHFELQSLYHFSSIRSAGGGDRQRLRRLIEDKFGDEFGKVAVLDK